MQRRPGLGIAALAATAALAVWPIGRPALADTAPARAQTAADADQIATLLFDTLCTRDQTDKLAPALSSALPPSAPPTWPKLMTDAAWEEVQAERPDIERQLSQMFTTQFTPAELAAGVKFLGAMAGEPPELRATVVPPAAQQVAMTPVGHSFMVKMRSIDPDTWGPGKIDHWIPAVLRRFGEKAQAAETPPPEDETARLRDEVACALLPADSMRDGMKDGIRDAVAGLFHDSGHPEWDTMLTQAVSEELDASAQRFCAELGPWIGAGLTAEEASKTLAFLATPDGAILRRTLAAIISKQKPPPVSAAVEARLNRFTDTPAGRKIVANFTAQGGDTFANSYVNSILPGVFRRFGEKALAAAH